MWIMADWGASVRPSLGDGGAGREATTPHRRAARPVRPPSRCWPLLRPVARGFTGQSNWMAGYAAGLGDHISAMSADLSRRTNFFHGC